MDVSGWAIAMFNFSALEILQAFIRMQKSMKNMVKFSPNLCKSEWTEKHSVLSFLDNLRLVETVLWFLKYWVTAHENENIRYYQTYNIS